MSRKTYLFRRVGDLFIKETRVVCPVEFTTVWILLFASPGCHLDLSTPGERVHSPAASASPASLLEMRRVPGPPQTCGIRTPFSQAPWWFVQALEPEKHTIHVLFPAAFPKIGDRSWTLDQIQVWFFSPRLCNRWWLFFHQEAYRACLSLCYDVSRSWPSMPKSIHSLGLRNGAIQFPLFLFIH